MSRRANQAKIGLLSTLTALLLACSGRAPNTASSAAPGGSSAAEQCLADARAPRHPSPDAPERIELRHILVRHRELARPEGATRTAAEACLRALEALQQLQHGSDWSTVALEFSDAKNSDLGLVSRDELSPPFADAAFELESGELSYVVETDRGFHVIARE